VSVITSAGQAINRVSLVLRAGSRRHLQAILPQGASVWSLAVDGQAVQPSLRTTADGRDSLLIPLPQQTSDDVQVDMVYVARASALGQGMHLAEWTGRHLLSGPRFDLPLKNITWQVYMPQGFSYSDFGGTMPIDTRIAEAGNVQRYDLQTYQRQIVEVNRSNQLIAQQQQTLARELAQKGEQTAARQALTKGYNFSIGNVALNEDIRVDLDNLLRQQAKVGLINARGRLRQQTGAVADGQNEGVIPLNGQAFSQQQAERIESSLGQADSENLELITRRVIQTQAAAEAPVSQLQVTMPTCGRMLQFRSPLQVEPTAEMSLVFTAHEPYLARVDPSLWYGLGLFGSLVLCSFAIRLLGCTWARLHNALTPTAKAIMPSEPAQSRLSSGPDDPDMPNRQVSAEELL
jgi:aspartate 1-decarboxylase